MTMPGWLQLLRIDHAGFLVPLDAITAALAVYLMVRFGGRSWVVRVVAALALGAATGLAAGWLVQGAWAGSGIALTPVARMWIAIAFAGIFLAVANLWGTRWWRKTVAIVFVPLVLVMAAAGINAEYGAYPHLRAALGYVPFASLPNTHLHGHAAAMDPQLGRTWQAPSGMPAHGIVGAVTIPGTLSHFPARAAILYLPPAALVAHPPTLPVVMLLSGQPGAPSDVFTAGEVAKTYDAYAAAHRGLAPIVIAPDQLAFPGRNPMCVDSPLGKSATYLTRDVPNWLRSHLRVADSPRYWAVGGYSQGGTCAIQFGAGRPDVFGSLIDVLGQLAPTIGPPTLARAFGGSQAAYDAVMPLKLLARNAPFHDTLAIFGSGVHDAKYTAYAKTMNAAARRAGMTTQLILAGGSGHSWTTVRYVWKTALPEMADHFGLGGSGAGS